MKTILNLSIVLMLIFGTAGAFNFYKMYKSGEIETLYSHDEPTLAHAVVSTGHVCTPAAAPKPLLERIEENIRTVELSAEDYSRGIIEPEIRIVEELEPATETAETESAEAPAAGPSPEYVKMVVDKQPALAVVEINEEVTPDLQMEEDPAKAQRKMKFKASMFSRAALVEEPIEMERDTVTTTLIDTLPN